jgi:hypothetical protein
MDDAERRAVVRMALGRIFRLGSRPTQPGDIEQYERCRAAIMEAIDPPPFVDTRPDWGRDRHKGAAGD